ncbi:MAG TPA: sugar nucleotide-binding protein, partial [Candidatus Aminicenantes bacterium]|nr:sugar nucleotide-binding protein [Candidatus Aminicenantes bacterium]
AGRISWYDFTVAIRDLGTERGLIGPGTVVTPIVTADYPTAAVRPSFSLLDKTRVVRDLGFRVRDWRENLVEFLAELGRGEPA